MRRIEIRRQWRERWQDPEVKPVARRLAAEVVSGVVCTESPFGKVDGRIDLRGLQVDLLGATKDPMYQRLSVGPGSWDGLDLSGAGLSQMSWSRLRVTHCVFDEAQLDGLRCWGVQVSDCSAKRASLEWAQLGAVAEGFERSAWRRVDFRGG